MTVAYSSASERHGTPKCNKHDGETGLRVAVGTAISDRHYRAPFSFILININKQFGVITTTGKMPSATTTDKLRGRIDRIGKDVDACIARIIVAVLIETRGTASKADLLLYGEDVLSRIRGHKLPSELRYFQYIGSALITIRESLEKLDSKRILMHWKAGDRTQELFENRLRQAIEEIDKPSYDFGILSSIKEVFEHSRRSGKHSIEALSLLLEVRGLARRIRYALKILSRRPTRFLVLNARSISLFLILVALLGTAIRYSYQAVNEEGARSWTAVEKRLTKDIGTLRDIAEDQSTPLHIRAVAVTRQVADMVSLIPNMLICAAIVLGLLQRIPVLPQGQQRALLKLRSDLLTTAEWVRKHFDHNTLQEASMDPLSTITLIAAGLKLVDQFRDMVFRIRGVSPPPVSATAEKAGSGIEIRSGSKVEQKIEAPALHMNQWDAVRYDALHKRIKTNWLIYSDLFASEAGAGAMEGAKIRAAMSSTQETLCKDFREMVSLYERALGISLPDHYRLHEVCGS